jgi:hypothetical protein
MRLHCDCFQCFVKHALESARLVSGDERVHRRVLRAVLRRCAELDMRQSPPAMVQFTHRVIRRAVGDADPYRRAKARHNALALKLLPGFERQVRRSRDPFAAAVRFAIAGNCIDMGTRRALDEGYVLDTLKRAAAAPLGGDVRALQAAVRRARRILYLADNAGEIVLDRLLLRRLPRERVTVAVRGRPILNDAIMADARRAGLGRLVALMDNGSDAPGTILADCSPAFRREFAAADLVISKGQGNYETLSEADKHIFFLFMAKCPLICGRLGRRQGDMVVMERRPEM